MNFQWDHWILHEKSFNCCDWNSRQKYSIYDTNTLCIHNIIYLCIHYCYWKSNIPMNPPFRLFIGLFVGWKTFQEIFLGNIYTVCGNFLKGNIEKLWKPMFESLSYFAETFNLSGIFTNCGKIQNYWKSFIGNNFWLILETY